MDDWQKDAIIYQIFPERFNIGMAGSVYEKRDKGHYGLPEQRVRSWSEKPVVSRDGGHQYDFWGGDIRGITAKIDYIKELGANTVYMTPVFWGHTNHKYDCLDYFAVDPDFGTEEDLIDLINVAHDRGLKIILDGVFNHIGMAGKWFNGLNLFDEPGVFQGNPERKDYFAHKDGHFRGWMDSRNLLELNLENPELQRIIYSGDNSIVKHWLNKGIDGWRLDVAYDIGPKILSEISTVVKEVNAGASLIGEIWNYPKGWREQAGLDGLMNYYYKLIIWELLNGYLQGREASKLLDDVMSDCGLDFMSKSWNILSSHDVPRLRTELKSFRSVKLALVLQYSLPGIPMIYYGEELEMEGGHDPENRGPMAWERLSNAPETYYLFRRLNEIRRVKTALRRGGYRGLVSSDPSIVAFKRFVDKIDDLVVCLVNPSDRHVKTRVYLQEGMMMNGTVLKDMISEKRLITSVGSLEASLEPGESLILEPLIERLSDSYTPYKRVSNTSRLKPGVSAD